LLHSAIKNKTVPPTLMEDLLGDCQNDSDKAYVMKSIHADVTFAAVEDGYVAPAVMEEVMANVRPEDTKSQILKKVRIAIEKRYITLSVMEQVLATIKPKDTKKEIIKKICNGKFKALWPIPVNTGGGTIAFHGHFNFESLILAVAKGQVPQSVVDDMLEDMRPCDNREDVIRKLCRAMEKKLVPQPVVYEILHPNEDGSPMMEKVRYAMKKKKLSPSVVDDIAAHVGPGEKKTEVVKKIRQGTYIKE
ncbi:hypothetical protein HF086_014403, partial [Spodoptera exigua]